jgi:hypothetical protein
MITMTTDTPQYPKINRRRLIMQLSAGLTLPLILTSCAEKPAPLPEVTNPGGTLKMGIAALDIINDYTTPSDDIFIDDIFNPSPAARMMAWAERTLQPSDSQGNGLMTITNASMTERDIQSDQDLKTLFTNEQRLLIEVKMNAIFTFNHPENNRAATLTVSSEAMSSIADNTSPAQADAIRLRVVDEALGQFDQELRRRLMQVSASGWPLRG